MFNFIITEVCDWKCEYCMFPYIQRIARHTTKEIIDTHIGYINEVLDKIDPDTVTVQGGEVGHVPEYILEYFFERINRKIEVSTNGQFLRREFHKNQFIRPKIKKIMLHISDQIDPYKLDLDYDINDPDIKIVVGIVDVRKDPERIKKFLELNSNILFEYIDYEHPLYGDDQGLDKLYKSLYDSIKNLSNVSEQAKERLRKRYIRNDSKNISINQGLCMRLHPCVFIDLVNEHIPLCIRNYSTVYNRLNKKNLIDSIVGLKTFDYTRNLCSSCFRICQDEGVSINQLERKREHKRKLEK